jgi:membrane protein
MPRRGQEAVILGIVREAFDGWNRHHTSHLAAALAFYLAFSLAPVLVIAIAIAGLIIGQKHAEQDVLAPLATFVGPSGARFLTNLVNGLSKPATNIVAATIGIVALVFGASGAFTQLQDALNIVFDTHSLRLSVGRIFASRALAFCMVLAIGLLLLALQILGAVLVAHVGGQNGGLMSNAGGQLVVLVAALLAIGALFAALFRFVPATPVAWADALPGGLFTGALFVLGQWGVSLLAAHTMLRSIHGAAAAGLIVLSWLFYSATVVLFGAEFTRAYAAHRTQTDLPLEA